jgi:hypothetical protein
MGKKKTKRTYTVYKDEKTGMIIIDKPKEDMNHFELRMIECFPKVYTNVVRDDDDSNGEIEKDWKKELDKRQKIARKKTEKKEDDFWNNYSKYIKNPKKHEKKLSKTERQIMKFFNQRAKKAGRKNKEKKELKKAKKSIMSFLLYTQHKQEVEKFERIVELKTGKRYNEKKHKFLDRNPNKSFFNNNADNRDYNPDAIVLLKTLEDEIMNHLNDASMFDPDNIVVQYNEYESDKKVKKKKSKKEVDRLII